MVGKMDVTMVEMKGLLMAEKKVLMMVALMGYWME